MAGKRGFAKLSSEEFETRVQHNRQQRMVRVDQMPVALRGLVHEYGLNVVQSFLDQRIDNPRTIRHIVNVVLDEFSPTRGSYARQGIMTRVEPPA